MPTPDGRRAFHDFVLARCDEARCSVMSGGGLRELRAHERSQLQAPVELATPLATMCEGRRVSVVPTIVPVGCAIRADAIGTQFVVSKVAAALGLTISEVQSQRRTRSVVMARRLSLLVWVRQLQRPAGQMANTLGIAASTASLLLVRASHEVQELAGQIARAIVVATATCDP